MTRRWASSKTHSGEKDWLKTTDAWREESRMLPKIPHQTTVGEVV